MKKQNGFSLVETLIAVTLIAVSGLAAASFADIVGRMSKQTRNKSATGILKSQITSKLFSEQAWNQTYLDTTNANMQCIRDGNAGDCSTVGSNLPFRLLDARGDVVSDPSNANLGFTEGGLKCTTFVTSPNDCPFRINFTWTPICPTTGTCPNPQVLVSGTFQQNTVNGAKLLEGKSSTFNFLVVPTTENFSNPLAETDTFFVDFNNSASPAPTYTLDVLSNDITETGMPLTLGALPSATSTKGGSLTINASNQIVYVPPLDFYGVDTFQYVAQDIHGHTGTGVVWIRVMTPFTWTGEGNGKASSANNWCGTVTANLKACSHLGVTAAPKFTRYLIFNENCIGANCNPDLDFAITNTTTGNDAAEIGYVHITSGFSGNITQSQNLVIKHDSSNSVLPKLSGGFLQEGATFTGGASNFIKVTGFQYDPDGCGTGIPPDPAKAVRINAGTFIAPGKLYSNLGLEVAAGATFTPGSGEVIVAGTWCAAGQTNSVSTSTNFHLLTLGSKNGTVADFSSSDPIALAMNGDVNTQDLNFNATNESFSVYSVSPSTNPPGAPAVLYNINVTGQITMSGTGGSHTTGSWGCPSTGPGACRNSAIRMTACGSQTLQGISLATPEGNRSYLPGLIIDKTCGNVVFKDAVGIKSLFWLTPAADTYLQANPGVFATAGSTFDFMSSSGDNNPECGGPSCVIPRSLQFNHLEFHSSQNSDIVLNQANVIVNGHFKINPRVNNDSGWGGQAAPNPPTIVDVKGDYEIDGNAGDQSFPNAINAPIVRLSGLTDQSIIGHYHEMELRTGFQELYCDPTPCKVRAESSAHIHINKTAGNLRLIGNVAFQRDFKLLSLGTNFITAGSKVTTTLSHWSGAYATFNTPGKAFNDVMMDITTKLDSDIIINGNLDVATNIPPAPPAAPPNASIEGTSYRIMLAGNLNFAINPVNVDTVIELNGTGPQTVTFTNWMRTWADFSGSLVPAQFIINKPSGAATFFGNFNNSANYATMFNVSRINLQQGTLNLDPSSNVAVKHLHLSAGTTLNRNGAPLGYFSQTGTGTINP